VLADSGVQVGALDLEPAGGERRGTLYMALEPNANLSPDAVLALVGSVPGIGKTWYAKTRGRPGARSGPLSGVRALVRSIHQPAAPVAGRERREALAGCLV